MTEYEQTKSGEQKTAIVKRLAEELNGALKSGWETQFPAAFSCLQITKL